MPWVNPEQALLSLSGCCLPGQPCWHIHLFICSCPSPALLQQTGAAWYPCFCSGHVLLLGQGAHVGQPQAVTPLAVPACPRAVTRALGPRSEATLWHLQQTCSTTPGQRESSCSTQADRASGTEPSGSIQQTRVNSCLTTFLLLPCQHSEPALPTGCCFQLSTLWSFPVSTVIQHHTRVSLPEQGRKQPGLNETES